MTNDKWRVISEKWRVSAWIAFFHYSLFTIRLNSSKHLRHTDSLGRLATLYGASECIGGIVMGVGTYAEVTRQVASKLRETLFQSKGILMSFCTEAEAAKILAVLFWFWWNGLKRVSRLPVSHERCWRLLTKRLPPLLLSIWQRSTWCCWSI